MSEYEHALALYRRASAEQPSEVWLSLAASLLALWPDLAKVRVHHG